MSEKSNFKYSNIFWGLTLVAIGVLLALRNFDIFYFRWHSILRLWPLIFVFLGISLIPVRAWIKMVLTFVVILIGILIVSLNPDYSGSWPHIYYNDDGRDVEVQIYDDSMTSTKRFKNKIDLVNVNLEVGAAKFNIKDNAEGLFELIDKSKEKAFNASSTREGRTESIEIKQIKRKIKGDSFYREAELYLNNRPAYDFDLDVGAAEIELDLKNLKVNELIIDGGASDIKIELGDRQKKSLVEINSGIASIDIYIPESVACEIHTETFLSSKDFDGFDKIGRGHYQTPNFSTSASQIIIEIDAAISDLEVIRY